MAPTLTSLVALLALILSAVGTASAKRGRPSHTNAAAAASPAPASARTSVMVLYFDNNTNDKAYDSLAKGLADMMITDLSAVPRLQVVEREKLEALLAELKLERTKYFEPKTAQHLGKGVGAAYAVTGAFMSLEPDIRIDVRMIKTDSGVVMTSAHVTGHKEDFFALQQQLAQKLVEGLVGVLSKDETERLAAATAANRLDDLGAALDYAKGLDASDRGDLADASRQLQKVVNASPGFQLGKDRYQQILKQLYAAKGRREELQSQSERTLLDHIEHELSGAGRAGGYTDRQVLYGSLLGRYHLTKIARVIGNKGPTAAYRDHVRAYVDNALRLFEATQMRASYSSFRGLGSFAEEDTKLAQDLNLHVPAGGISLGAPSDVLREVGSLLVDNGVALALDGLSWEGQNRLCFFELDPSYRQLLPDIYQRALAHIAANDERFKERETMRTLREYAHALAVLGRREEALAKLQEGLDRYPKSEEFKDVERDLRRMLGGKLARFCKTP